MRLLVLVLIVITLGCGVPSLELDDSLQCPPPDPAEVARAGQVKARHEAAILELPPVIGLGVGRAMDSCDVVIHVYGVELTDEVYGAVPDQLESVRVELVETGEFRPR